MAKLLCFAFLLALAGKVCGEEFPDGKNAIYRFFTDTSEDLEPFVFECPKDGLFPYVRNCSTFIQCSNGEAHLMPCPVNLHFSVQTQRCEKQCEAHCDRTLACDCGWSTCNKELCFLQRDVGPCRGGTHRYYYNKELAVCKHFIYFGCGGNENNFKTIKDCEKVCGDAIDVCKLPSRKGPCRKFSKKYFFNSKKGRCQKFTYGGCLGNGNNFGTKEECEQKCLKKVEDVVPEEKRDFVRDRSTEVSEKITEIAVAEMSEESTEDSDEAAENLKVGSVHLSELTDISEEGSAKRLPMECLSDPDPGPCNEKIPRWNYVSRNNKCIKFMYGGCKGNGNNFYSKIECKIVCANERKTEPECPQPNGNFSVPTNCSKYIECIESDSTLQECSKGNSFDIEKKICVPSDEATCYLQEKEELESQTFKCPEKTGNFSVPIDCSQYIECKNSKPTNKGCPTGQSFDSRKKLCVPWYEAICNRSSGRDLKFPIKIMCPERNGNFSVPQDCTKYIDCNNSESTPKECPKGQFFDSRKKICVPWYEALCYPGKWTQAASKHIKCRPEGDFSYHPDCKKFIRCRKTFLSLEDCPEDKTFDTVKRQCLPDEEAKCFR